MSTMVSSAMDSLAVSMYMGAGIYRGLGGTAIANMTRLSSISPFIGVPPCIFLGIIFNVRNPKSKEQILKE